ncbi:MAG: hypothetical protein ABI895_24850 [Deltaproteobacteria bacterium]
MKESRALQQQSSEAAPSLVAPSLAAPVLEGAPESREAVADPLEVSSDDIAIGPYSDDADDEDDVVTLQMDTPLDDGEWMLQTSAYERRRLSTEQLSAERASGLPLSTRVWRNGMRAWTPLGEVDLSAAEGVAAAAAAAGAASKGGATPKASSEKPGMEEPAAGGTRPLVPPLAAPPKRAVLPLPSPPPPRMAPSPSRPGAAPASSPVLGSGAPASARALGSSPSSALGFGASRALGLSPPPPRVEVRSEPVSAALRAFDAPPLEAQPAARRVDTATSVALDLGPAAPRRSRAWGGLVAQGAAVVLALLGTSYALTRAGVFEPGATVARQASARLALQPVPVASGSISAPIAAPAAPIAAPSARIAAAAPPAAPEPAAVAQETAAAPTADVSPASDSDPSAGAALSSAGASKSVASKSVASKAAVSKAAVSKAAVSKAAVSKAAVPAAAPSPAAEERPSGSAAEAPAVTKEATEKSDGAQKPAAETAPAGGDSATADPSSPDPSSPRAKRAARRAAALEARRQQRAARAAGSAPRAEPGDAATPALEPGSTFDRQAAQAALTAAADQAKNCRPIGGPSGAGTVQVQYEPTGRVGLVTIVTPGFENSDAGACIQMLFRRARVPAFNGAKGAVMRQRFEIP